MVQVKEKQSKQLNSKFFIFACELRHSIVSTFLSHPYCRLAMVNLPSSAGSTLLTGGPAEGCNAAPFSIGRVQYGVVFLTHKLHK